LQRLKSFLEVFQYVFTDIRAMNLGIGVILKQSEALATGAGATIPNAVIFGAKLGHA